MNIILCWVVSPSVVHPLHMFSCNTPFCGVKSLHYYLLELKRNGAQTEMQEIRFKHKKELFYSEGDQTLDEGAQRGCGVSPFGDTQKLSGYSPEQPAAAAPALRRRLDQTISRGALQSQPVSDSVRRTANTLLSLSIKIHFWPRKGQ